jgi:protein FAM32A
MSDFCGGELKLKKKRKHIFASFSPSKKKYRVIETHDKNSKRTEYEQKRDRLLLQRNEELLCKAALKSYRDRVSEYTRYLGSLSEYHDIQKVSGGTRK